MAYTSVVVGLDGSQAALLAVDGAARAAVRERVPLVVVCAFHPVPAREQAARTTGTADARLRVTGTEAAQEMLRTGLERARAAGAGPVTGRLVESDAVDALLTLAREEPDRLLVVANRGAGGLGSRLGAAVGVGMGTVALAVVQRAPCDVLVVRV